MEGADNLRKVFSLQHNMVVSRIAKNIGVELAEQINVPIRAADRTEAQDTISLKLIANKNINDEVELSEMKRVVDGYMTLLKDEGELISKLR
jgi:hypothetical protein